MSYKRKKEDKRRLKKLADKGESWWPSVAYEKQKPNKKPYLVRYWKSEGKDSRYSSEKKLARKKCRLYLKRTGVYTKKAYDLWWNYD